MELSLSEIQLMRKQLNLTQSELANISGVSQSLIAKIEAGKIDPTYTNAQKIISALTKISKKEQKKVSEIMSLKLISLHCNNTILDAIMIMKKHGISQLPIVDEKNNPVGYISENIILDAILNATSKDDQIKKIMNDSPPIITEDSPVDVLYGLLKYYPMVMISKNGKLKGIVTKSDLITNI